MSLNIQISIYLIIVSDQFRKLSESSIIQDILQKIFKRTMLLFFICIICTFV